jgi:hypothetical protein
MTKTASAGFQTHLGLDRTRVVLCWKVVPRFGLSSLGFTEHDENLVIDIGDGAGNFTYRASTGFVRHSITTKSSLNVDRTAARGFLDSASFAEADLRDGLYDGATVYIFAVHWDGLADGTIKLIKGWIGKVTHGDLEFQSELRGLHQLLQQRVGDIYSQRCRVKTHGDWDGLAECKFVATPDDWLATTVYALGDFVKATTPDGRRYIVTTAGTSDSSEPTWDTTIGNTTADATVVWTTEDGFVKEGTVDVVTSDQVFTITGLVASIPDNIFSVGHIEFLSGINSGFEMDIKLWVTATSTVTLLFPMRRAVSNGDSVRLTAGCDRTFEMCRDQYDNILNYRGEPYAPNNDAIFSPSRT